MISVKAEQCQGCGACMDVCPASAIYLVEGTATIDTDHCDACGLCVDACPHDAIYRSADEMVPTRTAQPYAPIQPAIIQHPPLRAVVWPWLGTALAFTAREIVPRVANELLAAWDRRALRQPSPTDPSLRDHPPLVAPGQRQHRRRHRGGNRPSE